MKIDRPFPPLSPYLRYFSRGHPIVGAVFIFLMFGEALAGVCLLGYIHQIGISIRWANNWEELITHFPHEED